MIFVSPPVVPVGVVDFSVPEVMVVVVVRCCCFRDNGVRIVFSCSDDDDQLYHVVQFPLQWIECIVKLMDEWVFVRTISVPPLSCCRYFYSHYYHSH